MPSTITDQKGMVRTIPKDSLAREIGDTSGGGVTVKSVTEESSKKSLRNLWRGEAALERSWLPGEVFSTGSILGLD